MATEVSVHGVTKINQTEIRTCITNKVDFTVQLANVWLIAISVHAQKEIVALELLGENTYTLHTQVA